MTSPEKETSYAMDGVENIMRVDEREKDVDKIVELRVNSRNQIVSRNGAPLTYDANGNLIHYVHRYFYDWKNQLARVEKADGSVVRFAYDALGRRIGKEYVTGSNQAATRYVYDGWRVIEERDDTDVLKSRYTYGNGIDEAVVIEKDRDGDGVLESYYPVLNNIGSVVGIADSTGKLVEKVDYATYGAPTFICDHASPEVDVVRVKERAILIRFSEPVKRDKAQQAIKVKKGAEELGGGISFEDEDRAAKFTASSPLPRNEALTVNISTDLEDLAQNKLAQAFSRTFAYSGADLIAYDRTAPEVVSIRLFSGVIYVEFSEEIDPATITATAELSSAVGPTAGEISLRNERTVKFTPASTITPGIAYTVKVKTGVKDLSGKSLPQQVNKTFTTSGSDLIIYQKPDPNHQPESYIGNTTLFQGREFDQETNLYYFRARYLHPELGRFIQPDPKGYVDSMNLYQSFGNNPGNFSDPMGTIVNPPLASLNAYLGSSHFQERWHTTRAVWGEVQASVLSLSGGFHEELYAAIAWTVKTRAGIKKKTMAEMAKQPLQYQGYEEKSKGGLWDPDQAIKKQRYFRKMWEVVDDVILNKRTDPTEGATHFYSRLEDIQGGDKNKIPLRERLKVPCWAVDWVRMVNGKQVVTEFPIKKGYLYFEKETTMWEVTQNVSSSANTLPKDIPIITPLLNMLFERPSATLTTSKLIEKKTSWEIPSIYSTEYGAYIANWRFYKDIKF